MMKSAVYANYSPQKEPMFNIHKMATMWPMQTLGSFDLLYSKTCDQERRCIFMPPPSESDSEVLMVFVNFYFNSHWIYGALENFFLVLFICIVHNISNDFSRTYRKFVQIFMCAVHATNIHFYVTFAKIQIALKRNRLTVYFKRRKCVSSMNYDIFQTS
jgi:hypothetical protein